MKNLIAAAGLALGLGLTGCGDVNIYKLEEHQGAFIVNEGNEKSSISYYNYEREECSNNIYQERNNGADIGAGATQIAIRRNADFPEGLAFVTLPADNSIAKIDLNGYLNAGSITDFTAPRDILVVNESQMFVAHNAASVSLYDYTNNTVEGTFDVAAHPQKLISAGKYLYVACSGDETGAKVVVIDMSNAMVVSTIDLNYNNPIDMVVDIDRNVWVYCSGDEQALVKLERTLINEEPYVAHEAHDFMLGVKKNELDNPLTISRDGRTLYYVYDYLVSKSVYIEAGEDMTPENSAVVGDYSAEAFNGIDWDSRTGRIMALTADGHLVILKKQDEGWNNQEEYPVGDQPRMSAFNF
ncbi:MULTISPECIES: YncE family protein [unclassified Carboxylicivirga]|uniref:YncE family protein n=1 Tax=Carboxylicivirga TaxID=1628153 RepID=UPI003D351508